MVRVTGDTHITRVLGIGVPISLFHRHFRNVEGNWSRNAFRIFLGSLLGKSRSAIGQFFPLFPLTVPEVFEKVNSPQFPFRL